MSSRQSLDNANSRLDALATSVQRVPASSPASAESADLISRMLTRVRYDLAADLSAMPENTLMDALTALTAVRSEFASAHDQSLLFMISDLDAICSQILTAVQDLAAERSAVSLRLAQAEAEFLHVYEMGHAGTLTAAELDRARMATQDAMELLSSLSSSSLVPSRGYMDRLEDASSRLASFVPSRAVVMPFPAQGPARAQQCTLSA